MRKIKEFLPIIIFYLVLAIIFTWPLASNLNDLGFGIDEDSPYHVWHNWWLKFSLFDLKQSPLWTNYIFYPQKIPLIYDANSFIFAAFTLPLQFLTKSVLLSSNIIFLFSFILSGLSTFLLARKYIKNRLVLGLCGIVFSFSPYILAQSMDGHTNLTTVFLIPLYTLLLLKTIEAIFKLDSLRRIGFLAALTGLTASLQLYSDFTYTSFLLIETVLISVFFLFSTAKKLFSSATMIRIIVAALAIGLFSALIASPLLIEVFRISRTGFRPGSPLWVQNEWSADLKSFLHPPDRSTLFKPISYTSLRGAVEGTVFPGYTVITLTLLAMLNLFKNKLNLNPDNRKNIKLWLFLAVSFFILSLGPTLHYDGEFRFDLPFFKDIIFPLPWLLLHKIPFIGEVQESSRLNPFLMLPLALTSGMFLDNLFKNLKSGLSLAISLIFIALVTLEYLPTPFPVTDLKPPKIYEAISADRENFSILTLPLGFNSGNIALGKSPIGSLQYYQVIHQHPSFRGTVARLPSWAFDYYLKLPLIKYLIDPDRTPDADDLDNAKVYDTVKKQLNIGYIVIHKDEYEKGSYKRIQEILIQTLPLEFVSEDERTIAYRLT